jgi:alkyl hydroperoxide reductase 1
VSLNTDEWKDKKVVLFSVVGAFTVCHSLTIPSVSCLFKFCPVQPTCHTQHLPPFLQKYDEFKAKGVDVIAVIAANDPHVMFAWGRVEGVQDKVTSLPLLTLIFCVMKTSYIHSDPYPFRPQCEMVCINRPRHR